MADNELMLRRLLSDIAREQNYKDATIKIEATSSEGANYTSLLYFITMSAPDKEELKLFAKVANLNEKAREVLPSFIYNTERFVYQDLANIFKRIEQKAEVPEKFRYVFPKVYGYNKNIYEETIVMENLASQGYIVYDRMKCVDWPYASKAFESIAKFHALTMAYEEQNSEEFNTLSKKLAKVMEPGFKAMSDKFDIFISKALSATREENKEKLKKYFDRITTKDTDMFRFRHAKRRAVLIHGDFRPSNIMHKVNEDGTVDLIPLDFQTIQGGCPLSDLLYFIFTGSDAEFRAKYYQRLIDHYYDSLAQELKRLRLDPKKIYPREDFDYDLRETLPYGLVVGVFLLGLVMVDSEEAPDFNNDDIWTGLAKPKISPEYCERLNGVIDDYVRWGVL